jgi:HEAT repeat protein
MNLEIRRPTSFSPTQVVVWSLALLFLSGCSGFRGWMPSPWSSKPPATAESQLGIKAPYQRMEEYREMARKASSYSGREQQELATRLAGEYRQEGDPLIRAQIVRTISGFPARETDQVLRAAMEDGSIDVRIAACEVWSERKGPDAIELLGQRLASDTNGDVRLAAARGLGDTGSEAAASKLAVALEDSDPALQIRAVESLRKLTGKEFGNDVNRWQQYVRGETPAPAKPVSVAERIRQFF